MIRFCLSLLFIIFSLACKTHRKEQPEPLKMGEAVEIIFVGNSQTYTHDVPKLIQEIGALEKNMIRVTNFTNPNYALEDHWNEGLVQVALKTNRYDFMVAQQGSSALPESQILLKDYAKRFADECQQHKIQMNLYMVWPMRSRLFDLDNVIYSYGEAAKYTGASLSPVGLALKKVWEKSPNFDFYSSDGLHATKQGSILAAMTIYASLFKKADVNFITLDKMTWANDLTKEEFVVFQKVVDEIF